MAYQVSEVKARANSLLQETLGPSAERIRSTLRDLGFSGHAADAFYALVRISHATAGDLVVKTGIPDSKIYYALDELAEKGIVEVQEGKPKTYRAVPEIPILKDLEKAAEVRAIVCGCVLVVVDGQQVLTVSRTADGDAYAITSTDPTLVQLGLDYWESPRCCVM